MLIRPAHELGWLIPLLIPGTWYWPKAEKDHILRTDALLQLVGLLPTWCIVDALKCPLWTGASKSKGQPPNIAKPWFVDFCWLLTYVKTRLFWSSLFWSNEVLHWGVQNCWTASHSRAAEFLSLERMACTWAAMGCTPLYVYIYVLYCNVLYWIVL